MIRHLPASYRICFLRGLAWLIASCLAASLAHAAIELGGAMGSGGSDYAAREHVALGPVLLAALVGIASALGVVAVRAASGNGAVDPVTRMATRAARMRPFAPCSAVAAGALALLLGMEFCEQLAATGHVEGVADALGGSIAFGLAVTVATGVATAFAGLRFARALVDATAHAARAVATAFVRSTAAPAYAVRFETLASRPQRRRHASEPAFLARCHGRRAPPRTRA